MSGSNVLRGYCSLIGYSLVFLSLVFACSPAVAAPRRKSGERRVSSRETGRASAARLSNLPVMVIMDSGVKTCTGVLVSGNTLLTSQKCARGLNGKVKRKMVEVVSGEERKLAEAVLSPRGSKVALVKMAGKVRKLKPHRLLPQSRFGFAKDVLAAGIGGKSAREIGYINVVTANASLNNGAGGSSLDFWTQATECFGQGNIPALVRTPTAVVGIPTYGFGECLFEQPVTFLNAGERKVIDLIRKSKRR